MAGTLVIDTLKSSTSGAPAFQNTSGTEIGTLCRAWVTFVGSSGSILGSFNVSSVTRNSTGDYTIAFSNAMPSSNFSIAGTVLLTTSSSSNSMTAKPGYTPNVNNISVTTYTAGSNADLPRVYVQVFN